MLKFTEQLPGEELNLIMLENHSKNWGIIHRFILDQQILI
jgi:hypothetical protein